MKQTLAVLACAALIAGCGSGQAQENSGSDAQQADSQSAEGSGSQSSQGSQSAGAQSGQSAGGNASDAANDAAANASQSSGSGAAGFASDKARRSYALGVNIGNSLGSLPVDVDSKALSQGIADVVQGHKTRLSKQQVSAIMSDMVTKMRAQQQQQAEQAAAKNAKQAKQFLATNKDKQGVKVTASGLQYKVIDKGQGKAPDGNDKVTVRYTGRLPDGTVFDSTKKDGQPATFPVDAVIPGWTEALQMMKPGAKYKLFIPPDLAYGERGAGSTIGPNQLLIFDVTLENVEPVKGEDSAAGKQNSAASGSDSAASGADQQSGRSGSAM